MHSKHHLPGTDIDGGIEVMHHDTPGHPEVSIREGYEVTDMNPRIIVVSLIGLLVLMFGSCIVIVLVIRGFNQSIRPMNTTQASSLVTPGVQVPTEPHLQIDPVADRIKIDADNQNQVNSYGILSEEPGMERVHIPVDRAMTLVVEGKVPYRQPAPPVAAVPGALPAGSAASAQEPADPFAADAAPAEAPAKP